MFNLGGCECEHSPACLFDPSQNRLEFACFYLLKLKTAPVLLNFFHNFKFIKCLVAEADLLLEEVRK